jgi:glutaredoxin 3
MTESLELYGTSSCPFTAELREQLHWQGRKFVEYDVERDCAARARLLRMTGDRLVPALVDRGAVVSVGWNGRGCRV